MKANEFRVNNWIKADSGLFPNRGIVMEWQITDEDMTHIFGNFETGNYDRYQPIPLTEEWLVKFGFDRCETTDGHVFVYDTQKTLIQFFYCDINKSFQLNNDDIYIKHVHQLQNLYHALTGEELEIKKGYGWLGDI